MSENQLQVIVNQSGLDSTKAKYILDNFQNYFALASEWEKKAKEIIVRSGDQVEDIRIAREGRLELREKRIAIEKSRKDLKEQSLREGKAIDGIANILKALIVPIEEYLEKQEKFVEIQEEKKAKERILEIEKRMAEEDRIAAEKVAAEQDRLRIENEKLNKEAEDRERAAVVERKAQEDILKKERDKAESEIKAFEEKFRLEKKIQDAKIANEKAKVEAERRIIEEKTKAEKEKAQIKLKAERQERERLEEILKNQIECPFCHKKFQRGGE